MGGRKGKQGKVWYASAWKGKGVGRVRNRQAGRWGRAECVGWGRKGRQAKAKAQHMENVQRT